MWCAICGAVVLVVIVLIWIFGGKFYLTIKLSNARYLIESIRRYFRRNQ